MNKNVLKKSFWLMAATALAFYPHTVDADNLPTGGSITAGLGNISQNGTVMTVQQGTAKMIVDWKGFSIGTDHTVNFIQPSSSSVALNRVTGADPSVIQGHLNANGQVFLINPNGILFTPTAQVNVGAIIASTLSLNDADFINGNYKFLGSSSNAIINQGNLVAGTDSNGGNIVMIAAKITNEGTMDANGGVIALGAGSKVTLDLGGPVKLSIESGALEALIQNGGAIRSDGGTILLTAQAADALSRTVIKNTGVIEAQTLSTGPDGKIILTGGSNDRIEVGGTLDASAPNGGNGGFIETSAGQLVLENDLHVTSATSNGRFGSWLIDPEVIEIIAGSAGSTSGLPLTGISQIGADTLSLALDSSNIDLNASGWIDFQTAFNYSGTRDATLSLYTPTIKLGGNISSSNASLSLNFGGTYSSTPYTGNLYLYGASRSINSKGGAINFYGNIGGDNTNSLNIDTQTGAITAGAITHHEIVDGTFGVTSATTELLTFIFTADNKHDVVIDFTTGIITSNGTPSTISNGTVPSGGHINCPAGTHISLNASDHSGTGVVTVTLLGGGTTVIIPDPSGDITIPAGGLDITKFEYTTKSGNDTHFGTGSTVDVFTTVNANPLLDYTAIGGAYTIDANKGLNVGGDIRILTNYFINNSNSTALITGIDKTWQVWSSNTDPFNVLTGDIRGGLIYNFKQYNATYDSTTVLGVGNGFFYTYAPQLTVSLTGTITKEYNRSYAAINLTNSNYNLTGAVDGDTVEASTLSPFPTSGTYATRDVDTGIKIDVTGISASSINSYNTNTDTKVYGYSLTTTSASGNIGAITPAHITSIEGITANTKVYDTTRDATFNSESVVFNGLYSGDTLTIETSSTGLFDSKDVGTGKYVSITSLIIGGSSVNNYIIDALPTSTTGNIEAYQLTDVTGITAVDRVYNTKTDASIDTTGANFGLSGLFLNDNLYIADGAIGTFEDKNVGSGKTVTISPIVLAGDDAHNYLLPTTPITTTAEITVYDIASISGITASNKPYDGNTSATINITGASFSLPVSFTGEDLSIAHGAVGNFTDANVGTGKTVNITGLSLGGTDASNYHLIDNTAVAFADITANNLVDPHEFLVVRKLVPTFPDFSPNATLLGQSQFSHDGMNFVVNVINNGIISGAPASDYLPISFDSKNIAAEKNRKSGTPHRKTEIKDGDTDVRSAHGSIDALTDEKLIHSENK